MNRSSPSMNLWVRVRDVLQSLALSTRIWLAAAVGLVAIVLVYQGLVPPHAEMVHVLGGQEFHPSQIQAISQAFEIEGLADFRMDGARIRVPREHVAKYAAALGKHRVLQDGLYSPLDRAAEQTSWLTSSAQEDRRWGLGKQKMLAQMIEQMPEVEVASVLIDRSPARGLRSEVEVRATVTIKPRSGQELPAFRIRQVRNLVAGSVSNLQPENVTVVDLNGPALLALGTSDTSSDDLLARVKEFEEHFTWKIQNVLSHIPDVVVTVHVELDTTRQRRSGEVELAADDAMNSESRGREDMPVTAVSANAAVELESTEPDRAPSDSPACHTPACALLPKSVTVAVAVPQDIALSLGNPHGTKESDANSWKSALQERVGSVIPEAVATKISVTSFPREVKRLTTTHPSRARRVSQGWITWAIAVGCGIALALTLALGGIRFRKVRSAHLGGTRRALDPGRELADPTPHEFHSTSDHGRELVRIQRAPVAPSQGPHRLQATIGQFEDLRWLAPSSLQAVLSAVDSRLWAPALRGASRELCERILAHMPARASMLLRDEIEFPGPVRLGDVETAQQEIFEVVRRLDHTGDLVLEHPQEARHE